MTHSQILFSEINKPDSCPDDYREDMLPGFVQDRIDEALVE